MIHLLDLTISVVLALGYLHLVAKPSLIVLLVLLELTRHQEVISAQLVYPDHRHLEELVHVLLVFQDRSQPLVSLVMHVLLDLIVLVELQHVLRE